MIEKKKVNQARLKNSVSSKALIFKTFSYLFLSYSASLRFFDWLIDPLSCQSGFVFT